MAQPAQPPEGLRKAVLLFNAGRFFDCHEVLEKQLWQALPPGEEKTFCQGLIQVAVGLHHWQRGNGVGAKRLLSRGLEKLSLDGPWLDVSAVVASCHLLLETGGFSPERTLEISKCQLHWREGPSESV